VPKDKVFRTIKDTPLRGTLKMKDIEKAVAAAKRYRSMPLEEPLRVEHPEPDGLLAEE
jgi:hypothetical protein